MNAYLESMQLQHRAAAAAACQAGAYRTATSCPKLASLLQINYFEDGGGHKLVNAS